ncbi:MAG TPA: hypothetical protein PKE06_11475, partial [Flavilitoribacter sp.]|nr:hypothetical protein [Flavilitoribacter sp.]
MFQVLPVMLQGRKKITDHVAQSRKIKVQLKDNQLFARCTRSDAEFLENGGGKIVQGGKTDL